MKKDTDKNKHEIKGLQTALNKLEDSMDKFKKEISNIKLSLNAHINRQYTEIKVIEEDGKWGDYSGTFQLNDEEKEEYVIKKAEKHFETYFADGPYHRNKKLGLFINSARSGKRLVKIMKTEE